MSAADLIRKWEGCRLHAYPDPATGGKPWTIGYGITGPGIGPGTVWTQEQADYALEHRLAAVEGIIESLLKVPVTGCQMAALCSLAWNIGTHALAMSTVMRELNLGNTQAAADAFRMWDKANGKVMPGLVARREAEREVFLTPDAAPICVA